MTLRIENADIFSVWDEDYAKYDGFPPLDKFGQKLYPFKVRVIVPRKTSPRDWRFKIHTPEFIQGLLDGARLETTRLKLIFPEMWLNPLEEHGFMSTIVRNYPDLTHLSMCTNSPMMLSNFTREMILITDTEPFGTDL